VSLISDTFDANGPPLGRALFIDNWMPIVRDFFVLLILVVVPIMWRLPLGLAHRGALDLIRLGPILLNPLATNSNQRAIRDEFQVLWRCSSMPIPANRAVQRDHPQLQEKA
jgi:hypothetical protein